MTEPRAGDDGARVDDLIDDEARQRLADTYGPANRGPDMRYVETVQVKWLRDRLANIEELHSVRKRTVEGHTLRWCRECQQDWPCPTVELAGEPR